MAAWQAPDIGFVSQWTPIADTSGRAGVVPTSAATIAAKGAWLELFASTDHPGCGLIIIQGSGTLGEHRNSYLDIGIGGSGSEQVLIPDIWYASGKNTAKYGYYYFPCDIPKGSRLSCRGNCSDVSTTIIRVYAAVVTPRFESAPTTSPVRTYGATVATVEGTALAVSSTSAENAWVQLTAATEFEHNMLLVIPGKTYTDVAMASSVVAVDIARGASGQETELVRDLNYYVSIPDDNTDPRPLPHVPVNIPKGSRLAMRVRSSSLQTGLSLVVMGMG